MAYAAVNSLKGTLDLHFLQSEPRVPLTYKRKIVSLHRNLGFLQDSLEKSEIAYDDAGAMKDLEAEMRDVSFKAEERIEIELATIYLQSSSIEACLLRLHGIFIEAVQKTNSLKKKLIKIKSKQQQLAKGSSLTGWMRRRGIGSTSSQPADLERDNITVGKFSKTASMVGCDEEFKTIMDHLTRQSAKQLQVVSIVGMGGIGKTTLARKVYGDPSITSYFYKQAWVTVSQECTVGQMLRCLIGCVSASSDEQSSDPGQLAESLRKSMKDQRYLIVIDDIWSKEAWDSVQRCFPNDDNGSRILLTSRLREVAEYAASSSGNSIIINLSFLDANESWNLYCNVFGKTKFLLVIEQIGRDIVKKCKGLPLAITLVASFLSKTEEKVEKWKNVAESVVGDCNEACSRVLSLSYNQLPHRLKTCFLYFGIFPEDYEIHVKTLVKLWAAEGFFGTVNNQNLEELAMECLQDLVDRSLVQVGKQSYNGKIKTIIMHDLLRDLSLKEAQRENLLYVIGNDYDGAAERELVHLFPEACPWLSIRQRCFNIQCFDDKIHSLHSFDHGIDFNIKVLCHFKLLRVVDMKLGSWHFGDNVLYMENLVHLRYFGLSSLSGGVVGSLKLKFFKHWNMQSFIVRGCSVILDSSEVSKIWKMPLLRNFYVKIDLFTLEAPEVVHRNMETISWLPPECCTKDLFTMIPNLKKLGIQGKMHFESENSDGFDNFVHLGQLEKLSIKEWHLKLPDRGIQWATSFLPNLKKLKFFKTKLPWSNMRLIGMLPNLEVLKLKHACIGKEWEPSKGGFRQLKGLVIQSRDLRYWNAVGDHFPVLEHLKLSGCNLRKIPIEFADITKLALIQLKYCSYSVLVSARCIQDEQRSYGNDGLCVRSKYIDVSLVPNGR